MSVQIRRATPLLLGAMVALTFVACAGAPTVEPSRRPETGLAEFLLDPSPLAGSAIASEVAALHRRLRSEGVSTSLEAEIGELARGVPDDPAPRLLEAQAAAVAGEADRALDVLRRTFGLDGGPPQAEALRGWALELRRSWTAAVLAYREAAAMSPAAEERAAELESRAVDAAVEALDEALGRGRIEEARGALAALRQLRPTSPQAAEAALRVARATDDPHAELEALRALAPTSAAERRRWAMLEVEEGDAALGVRLMERAVAEAPGDAEVEAELERAKFLFRLANAPEDLRGLVRRPELDRAGLARLLFWLVPEVRATRASSARIATDILDDADRDEIARVVNLGLLDLDPALRTFSPERAATRSDVFGALEALRGLGEPGGGALRRSACASALRDGWIADAAECRPDGRVSGAEAVEWIRRATSRAGAAGGPE